MTDKMEAHVLEAYENALEAFNDTGIWINKYLKVAFVVAAITIGVAIFSPDLFDESSTRIIYLHLFMAGVGVCLFVVSYRRYGMLRHLGSLLHDMQMEAMAAKFNEPDVKPARTSQASLSFDVHHNANEPTEDELTRGLNAKLIAISEGKINLFTESADTVKDTITH